MQSESDLSLSHPLTRAGALITVGLVVQAVTLYWAHPLAFLAFIGIGGSLVAAGILLYLWALLAGSNDASKQ